MNLDALVREAREGGPTWSSERQARILERATAERERRDARASVVRRSVVAIGATLTVAGVLLRALSADAAPAPAESAELVVQHASDDGGYVHD